MSFGSSNPPWQRNTLGNTGQQNAIANLQSQMMNTNFVGFQNLAMSNQQQQNNLALIPQLGGNMSQMNNTNQMFANHQTIQYPSRQGLNPNAFSTVQNTQQILHHQAQSQPQQAPNQVNQSNMTGQMCNSAAFTKQWNTVVQQMNATSQSHGMNVRSNTNQSQLQHSGQPTQQQQQSSRNFSGYNASSQSQNSYASNFERASNSVRSSNHSSRQSPPARRSSPDRSNRREDEERKRRKERER